jgi:hypothetical protein
MARLLIADDLIPDRELSTDQEVRDKYTRLYSNDANVLELVEWFLFSRQLIIYLHDRGYDVDCANTRAHALNLVKRNTYDVIVLDLGWYTAQGMSYDEKMVLGFPIAREIREHTSTPIIMLSSRFPERNDFAETAADMGLLPVYKTRDDTCKYNLLVAVRWLLRNINVPDKLRTDKKIYAFTMYRRLSNVLLLSLVLSVALLGISIMFLLTHETDDVSRISSLFGVVSTFISGGIYTYIRRYEKSIV